MFLRLFLTLIIGTFPSIVLAQSPYGIEMGANPRDYLISMAMQNGFFRVEEPSARDPDFVHYFVKTHHATGVCAVVGGSKGIEGFGPGEAIRAEFTMLKAKLEKIHGETKTYDFVTKGERKLFEDNFITKLSMGEAFLGAIWDYDRGSKNLGDEIKKIVLYVKKEQGYIYNILAFYELNNINECRKNIARDAEPIERIK